MTARRHELTGWALVRLDGKTFVSTHPPGTPFSESRKVLIAAMHHEHYRMMREGLLIPRRVRVTVEVEEDS